MSTIQEILGAEQQFRALRRAMSIADFCTRYGVGRTTTYEEIKTGRLSARKCGSRTVITDDAAEEWLRRLPAVETRA
jgi:excisionase family DNA binding protein